MSNYQKFIFKDYSFDKDSKLLTLRYGYDDKLIFSETYLFDFDFVDYDEALLDRALQILFFLAGVSYYKAYLAPEIVVEKGQIDSEIAQFLGETYQKGLGEFFYVNSLDPRSKIVFPTNTNNLLPYVLTAQRTGKIIGIGGGKDSLVSVELLKKQGVEDISTWSLAHRSQLQPLVDGIGLRHFYVERTWDPTLLDHNKAGALNGHVPISAIIAAAGTVVAVLSGKRDVVVSNEQSANEPTLYYDNIPINHQFSKSLVFEVSYQKLLKHVTGDSVRYYSFLRPIGELYIAELFAAIGYDKYQSMFSSCNQAFTYDSNHMFWDGVCPKCAFVFLALTPFVDRSKLESLFTGKNLLLNPDLEKGYRQLLGIEGDKPLDCVGEIKESRKAMRLAQKIYPELMKYEFELPDNYDYRESGDHSMPPEEYIFLSDSLKTRL